MKAQVKLLQTGHTPDTSKPQADEGPKETLDAIERLKVDAIERLSRDHVPSVTETERKQGKAASSNKEKMEAIQQLRREAAQRTAEKEKEKQETMQRIKQEAAQQNAVVVNKQIQNREGQGRTGGQTEGAQAQPESSESSPPARQ